LNAFALAIHGGAGALSVGRIPQGRVEEMRRDLGVALDRGAVVLARGGSAVDAVVAAVCVLEDSPVFNAGRGAVLRSDGTARLDASVMDGAGRRAGAVCLVRTAQNPVRLAQAVLERGREVLLAGDEADRFAIQSGLAVRPPEYFVSEHRRLDLDRVSRGGGTALDHDVERDELGLGPVPAVPGPVEEEGQTVGAVALDRAGHLAAATSTGGMTNASAGRVGDSPIIGAGTWASDETCAISATGTGELFIRAAFAHEVHSRLAWAHEDLEAATRGALDTVVRLGGRGGCVAIGRDGSLHAPFTTLAMPRAYLSRLGERHVYVLEARASG
jgi:beta-aspartyl-peptidase (threonine type)